MIKQCLLAVSLLGWLANAAVTPVCAVETASNGPLISVAGVHTRLGVIATTALPGAQISIETSARARADQGELTATGSGYLWRAPRQPGRADIVFQSADGEQSRLRVFVLTPFDSANEHSLSGFRIGQYQQAPFKGLSAYRPPGGLINLEQAGADTRVSPHFTLGQFQCKQQPGHQPAYLLVTAALLQKLELLLAAARQQGWAVDTLSVMSGFRSPYYNAAIGNRSSASRHLYGDAADIYIDADGDGQMDDLNRDGRIDIEDAKALAQLAEVLAQDHPSSWVPGGLSSYAANAAHGPFVHIDARGFKARW